MGKIYDGIMGLVVGDALGVPFEFRARDSFKATDMVGYGTYNQPAGTWSDDSSMTLATLESIGQLGRVDPIDIMATFVEWLYKGKYTPYGVTFDVGGATQRAITRFTKGILPLDCGGKNEQDNGNGALMRILPVALFTNNLQEVHNVTKLTHAHPISIAANEYYWYICRNLLEGLDVNFSLHRLKGQPGNDTPFNRLIILDTLTRDEIKSSGYVVDTLEAALWCILKTDNYRDCVLLAVNLGEDTDTVAAVAGGLAGIAYGVGGERGIPEEWIEQIPRREWIADLCAKIET